jgi:hypothetical protein
LKGGIEMDSDKPLFEGIDEYERTYAPEGLPASDPDGARARLEGDAGVSDGGDGGDRGSAPPDPAPVAVIGTSPSSMAAPPNIGHDERRTGPGDPQTQADYPIGDDDDAEKRD